MAIKVEGKPISAKAQKNMVMGWTGWSSAEYNRQYDRLRNRVRNFERANGLKRGEINAADLLARHSRELFYADRQNRAPKETTTWIAVSKTSSASPGAPLSARSGERIVNAGIAALNDRFEGLRENSKYSRAIKAEIEALKKVGRLDYNSLKGIYEKYIAQKEKEISMIKAWNASIKDPFEAIEYNS